MEFILISHALCPYVQRVAITLAEKGLPYERVDVDLAAKPQWFLELSPLGKTPLLRVGEETLFESAAICDYLDETAGPAMHPADPLLRARHRAWIAFASNLLSDIGSLYTARDDDGFGAARAAIARHLGQLENVVQGPYFAGEQFGLVDAAFAPAFRYFELFGAVLEDDPFADFPQVAAWRNRLAARASVARAVPADYRERLRAFVVKRGGVLAERLARFSAPRPLPRSAWPPRPDARP